MWRRRSKRRKSSDDTGIRMSDISVTDTSVRDSNLMPNDEDEVQERIRKTETAYSLAAVLGDAASDDSFQQEVAKKTQTQFIGRQEAETEVFIDRLIQKEGDKNKALLFAVSKMDLESRVLLVVNTLLHRGANPSASNEKLQTPLHFTVKRGFKGVTAKLLGNDALPHARDKKGRLPLTVALDHNNDELAAMLLVYMPNSFVRSLFTSDGHKPAEFSFHFLLQKDLQKTALAVLDCMVEPYGHSGHVRVYYHVLDSDENGRAPADPLFDSSSKSPFQILAKQGNKTIVFHDAVRLLIRKKWKEYARIRFQFNSFLYVLTLLTLTFSAIVAVMTPNPLVYDSPLQYARAVFEIVSYLMGIMTFVSELNQLRKHRLEYWHDAFNYIDMASAILIICLLPLRLTERNEQWHVFAFAYVFWTLRIFKFAAVFRQTGAHAQILWRVVTNDFIQFIAFFLVILLAFSGSFMLSLRGEDSLDLHEETSTFWNILFAGVRILTEAAPVVEYTGPNGYKPLSCILMVVFLFVCIVILLNILIAQLSDTYQHVQRDAQRGLEVNRAWIIARVELNSLYVFKQYRVSHYKESENVKDLRKTLTRWETPPLSEMNDYIRDIWDTMDAHKMNLLTIQNRLGRQEALLYSIQSQLDQLLEQQQSTKNTNEGDNVDSGNARASFEVPQSPSYEQHQQYPTTQTEEKITTTNDD